MYGMDTMGKMGEQSRARAYYSHGLDIMVHVNFNVLRFGSRG